VRSHEIVARICWLGAGEMFFERRQKNDFKLGNHFGKEETICSYTFKAIMPCIPVLEEPNIVWSFSIS
jgi:hypothetical protein